MWVLSTQDSNTAPQTSQDTWPVCGIKNFASVRSYSAPQLHLTIVAILGICARNRPFSSVKLLPGFFNLRLPLPAAGDIDALAALHRQCRYAGHLIAIRDWAVIFP